MTTEIEGSSTFPVSFTDGTLAAQASLATDSTMVPRYQVGVALIAEYVIIQESSSDANYADRAAFARIVAANAVFWGQALAWLIVGDGTDIALGCTDQAILNRIWTIWDVVSYKASTVPYGSSTEPVL